MSVHVFRNYTIEHLFDKDSTFSGYNEFDHIPSDCTNLVWLYFFPPLVEEKKALDLVNTYLDRLNYVRLKKSTTQYLLVFTLSKRLNSFTKFENDKEIVYAVEHFNKAIFNYTNDSTVKIIDVDTFLNDYGIKDIVDWKYYYISQMIINPKLASNFKWWFQKIVDSIIFKRKKCIVLDLDNTLWGGILGEDGPQGIMLGGSYPGNAFKDFQKLIQGVKDTGIILAACSKNNEDDVLELWNNHSDIILKEKDFATWRINWNDKAQNIIDIAHELNIGTDSILFIDDNPSERERVKTSIPDITVPEFPKDPYLLKSYIENIHNEYFKIYSLTLEDLNKTENYRANIQRNKLQNQISSIDDFIEKLSIEIALYLNNAQTFPRVAQMTQKTNQFNLTTRRYSESDIKNFIEKGSLVFALNVKDKFGDDGITAAAIVTINKLKKVAEIDSFLLSCRILGKKIEDTFLKLILNKLYSMQITNVLSEYIATKKNIQSKDFYFNNGFNVINEEEGHIRYGYRLEKEYDFNNRHKIIIEA